MHRISSTFFALTFGAAMTLAAAAQSSMQSGADPGQQNNSMGKQSAGTASSDTNFMKKAAAGGLAEVELGQLAVQKASNEQVKQFGQRMIDDHSKANEQLKNLAAQEHVTLPTKPELKDRQTKDRLEKLSGTEFDQAYMSDMLKDHKKDVAEFERESKTAKNPAVKSFAEQTLPVLREHLSQAEQIAPTQKTQASNKQ
ncbi:MAG: DUF4142 domain-containing protein [Candidatus Sulfotelmatobacter sp.]